MESRTLPLAVVEGWSEDDVQEWLENNGFPHNGRVTGKFKEHLIDGYSLVRITEDDLRKSPMCIDRLGDIKRLIGAIDVLVPTRFERYQTSQNQVHVNRTHYTRSNSYSTDDAPDSGNHNYNRRRYSRHLQPERFKALVALGYGCAVLYICALIMTIVNDRVPDMEKYPPLPDLFLDNVPYISWAFPLSEYIAIFLFILFGGITFTHKHRFIIFRRFFSLGGTLYLLRAVCMLITSLSVPCRFFECQRHVDDGLYSKLWRALEIVYSGGMSLNGVRYCGDYMFSGHTTLLTLLSLFIDEYSDRNYPVVKTLSWVLNLFGIFFVMAGHEHYSIDVFIAFYLTTRLFLYYHTLADNKAQLRYDERSVRIWFPLFSYFEAEITGAVPHEYDWPISMPKFLSKLLVNNGKKTD